MKDIERYLRATDIISAKSFEDGYRQGWLSTLEMLSIIASNGGKAPREFFILYPEQTKDLMIFYKMLKDMLI